VTPRGWVLFSAMSLIWGLPYLLIKVAVDELSPVSVVFLRCAIAAVVLLPIALARGVVRPVFSRWRPLLVYTAVEMALPWLLLGYAEKQLSSSLAGLMVAAVPLAAAVLARWFGGAQPLGATRLTGLLVGFGGVAALVGLDVHGASVPAIAAVVVVVISYAVGAFVISRHLTGASDLGVIAVSMVICAVFYGPAGVATLPAALPSTRVLVAVLGLGLICSATAFLVFFRLIAEVGPERATVFTYVNPLVAVALGVAVLGETITVAMGAGAALILAGSFLATRADRSRRARVEATAAAAGIPSQAPGPDHDLTPL
jgi:drug/metabolite transporter (DMT)-like permease